jgi:hypothetical protein
MRSWVPLDGLPLDWERVIRLGKSDKNDLTVKALFIKLSLDKYCKFFEKVEGSCPVRLHDTKRNQPG